MCGIVCGDAEAAAFESYALSMWYIYCACLIRAICSGEEANAAVGTDIFDALRTSSPVQLRESATRFRLFAA